MTRLLFLLCALAPVTASAQDALRIDPLTLVALREARAAESALDLFPGWDLRTTPVLLYRPGVQDVLLGVEEPPEGFARYTGPSPLGEETIWIRNDSTHFALDGQNTVAEVGGHRVLVVADPASQARNQLRTFAGMEREQQDAWLDRWAFLGSPYDLITLMLHEGFHVHQYAQGGAFADESLIAEYPLYAAENNALQELEGLILLAAARGEQPADVALREFAAVRSTRHAALGAELSGYEVAVEAAEGLAKYVEYRFYQVGDGLTPHPDAFLMAGFDGYGRLAERFDGQLASAESLIRGQTVVNNDRFGAGNLRFRLYPMGALEALLLDRVAPGWTTRVFAPGASPSSLLVAAAGLAEAETNSALAEAKARYGYEALLAEKQAYEREGRAAAQAKADALLNTDQTLVRITYGDLSAGPPVLSYTPFGVTPLGGGRAIYELVPISAQFGDAARLSMNVATPVLVDPMRKEMTFAVDVPAAEIQAVDGEVRTPAFGVTGRAVDVVQAAGGVIISLK